MNDGSEKPQGKMKYKLPIVLLTSCLIGGMSALPSLAQSDNMGTGENATTETVCEKRPSLSNTVLGDIAILFNVMARGNVSREDELIVEKIEEERACNSEGDDTMQQDIENFESLLRTDKSGVKLYAFAAKHILAQSTAATAEELVATVQD